MASKILIIPDIHGRSFWRKAIEAEEYQHVVFLGDYLDPYAYEGLDFQDGMRQLADVIAYKHAHPDTTTLLLGNHDLAYLFPLELMTSRYNDWYEDIARTLLREHLDCFQMACALKITGKTYLFSHAGIHPGWVRRHIGLWGEIKSYDMFASRCTELLRQKDMTFVAALGEVSRHRGGEHEFGSMIWADVNEFQETYSPPGDIYQIFGHSQQAEFPVITDAFACLDCRAAFTLDATDGSISLAPSVTRKESINGAIIFLDIDGVMHSDYYDDVLQRRRSYAYDEYGPLFDPECVKSLQYIVDETGADIVISSSWKEDMDLQDFQEMWQQRSLPGKVIATTPCLDGIRGEEIKAWQDASPSRCPYVILDDMDADQFLEDQIPHFVIINAYCGLDSDSAERAVQILRGA